MDFVIAAETDVGIKKKTNQDSLWIRNARHPRAGVVLLAVLCDGMGGLQKGELASNSVLMAFRRWFDGAFSEALDKNRFDEQWLRTEWNTLLQEENRTIMKYGRDHGFQMGTTVTAFLVLNGMYYTVHIGDCRLYELETELRLLTKDQTLVAQEVQKGNMTEEEAGKDPRRNVLLQCVGASETLIPVFGSAVLNDRGCYLLCTDGFRHVLTSDEIFFALCDYPVLTKEELGGRLRGLIEQNKERMEEDNITAAAIAVRR